MKRCSSAKPKKNEDSDDSITAVAEEDEADEGVPSDDEAYDSDATDSDLAEYPSDTDSGRIQPGVNENDEKVALVDRPIEDDSSQNPKNSKDNMS